MFSRKIPKKMSKYGKKGKKKKIMKSLVETKTCEQKYVLFYSLFMYKTSLDDTVV